MTLLELLAALLVLALIAGLVTAGPRVDSLGRVSAGEALVAALRDSARATGGPVYAVLDDSLHASCPSLAPKRPLGVAVVAALPDGRILQSEWPTAARSAFGAASCGWLP